MHRSTIFNGIGGAIMNIRPKIAYYTIAFCCALVMVTSNSEPHKEELNNHGKYCKRDITKILEFQEKTNANRGGVPRGNDIIQKQFKYLVQNI